MLKLEVRPQPSKLMSMASPLLALLITVLIGVVMFALLGKDPLRALQMFFWEPIKSGYAWTEIAVKATPLVLIGLGLAICYRSNVWNIGAEGQYVIGAVFAGGIAMQAGTDTPRAIVLAILAAGVVGGMLWAAVVALLRDRFNANEILVSLMLVYVAKLLLSYLVHGPWRDPEGYNFPQSRMFHEAALLPVLMEGVRTTWAFIIALALAGLSWLFAEKTFAGFRLKVSGLAPGAASYAGFSEKRNVWLALLIGGATAGLAGVAEVAGPIGQLQPAVSPGYGFAAIIVAFVGRLHPLGVVLASVLMSLLYLGGETAQIHLTLPSAVTGVFQGVLLFYLLAADLFIHFRLRWSPAQPAAAPKAAALAGSDAA